MKQTRVILMTAIAVLFAFSATVYTSCKKDPCSGYACYNGGSCSGGSCSCPSGYSGTHCELPNVTDITYTNDTYTPINFTVNGNTVVIPVGGSVTYSGDYGTNFVGTASTSGTTSSGAQVGLLITWNLSDPFPTSGTSTIGLDVSSNYFFLKIINDNLNYYIGQVYVNYGLASQSLDYVTIPNTSLTYYIGYYDAWSNSNLYLLTSGGSYYWGPYSISLPFTTNQSYTFTAY